MSAPGASRALESGPSVVAVSVASNLLALAMPIALPQVCDRVIPHEGTAKLAALAAGPLAAALADLAVRLRRGRLVALASRRRRMGRP